MHAWRPTAVKQLANFSARLAGKAARQGWRARLPGKVAGQGCIARVHAMVQYARSMVKWVAIFCNDDDTTTLRRRREKSQHRRKIVIFHI
jgi:hypothetical protein